MKTAIAIAILLVSTSAHAQMVDFRNGSNSPQIYAPNGQYLGNLNANQYDSNSVSNPYGRYGSPYSSDSINNPYGRYGSPYSSQGVRNPYSR